MKVDFLIIGQGICGSFLSHYLHKSNKSFVVIDNGNKNTATKVASGVINPITGRRLVRTWMIEDILPFAKIAYQELEKELNINCCKAVDIIDFFATTQMKLAFEERLLTEQEYLKPINKNHFSNEYFNMAFGAGLITNCLLINLQEMLQKQRQFLVCNNLIINDNFNIEELLVSEDKIEYKNIAASKIIFCDGVANTQNKFFNLLPYAPNKGEALLVEINDLPATHIYKYGLSIVPWKDNLFWVGSTYNWQFDNEEPTNLFKEKTIQSLQQILKLPFKVVEHLCAIRPANIERRPFVGFHPIYKNVGLLNGMGTKGCSLAPYFAFELVKNILHQKPINPLVDIARFEKILSR